MIASGRVRVNHRVALNADKPVAFGKDLIEVDGQAVVIPWGATLPQVEQGLRALVEIISERDHHLELGGAPARAGRNSELPERGGG